MNFEDEEYVRVYTKKTITFRRLKWQGRTLLWHLMLEADRGGVVELGEGEEVEALCDLLDLPEGVVRVGLERLVALGVTSRHGSTLIIDRFVEAQEARRSDRMRAQEYRERQRSVTERHEPSREQTERHAASRFVTPPLPLPLPSPPPALPKIQAIVEQEPDVSEDDLGSFAPEPEPAKPSPHREAAERVFDAWAQDTGHPGAKRDTKRLARITARLRDGFTEAQLVTAIRNRRNDPYLMGSSGRVYDGIETLLRDVAQVERLLALKAPIQALPSRYGRPVEVSPNVDYETRQRLRAVEKYRELVGGAK